MGIVYFGSGPVAAESLELLAKDFDIEAVITKPKPTHHRATFPVIDTASALNLPVHTVSTKAELSELIKSAPFDSKLGVLIDFGIIISQDVIDYFPLGIVNSHFSMLPEWRGADPITFSILSGQKKTGVSLMLLVEKMDEGPLLAQSEIELSPDITTPQLTEELIELSHKMLQEVLPVYMDGNIRPYEQPSTPSVSYSRKLNKDDGLIDWGKPAEQIEREVRAYIGWPKSHTRLGSKEIIVTKAHVAQTVETKELAIKTAKDYLVIDKLKPASKQEMTAQAFLAGHKI